MPDYEGPPEKRNADLRRSLARLIAVIAAAVVSLLGLIWYLWESSPKPP